MRARISPPVFQGSTDHRGTPEFPGRTATLERCDASEVCWGAAYRVPAERRAETLEYLEIREKQYDERVEMDLYAADDAGAAPVIENAVTYIATPADINLNWLGDADDVAEQIAAVGPPARIATICTICARHFARWTSKTTICTRSRRVCERFAAIRSVLSY